MEATAKFTSVSAKRKKCGVPLYVAVVRADPQEKTPFDTEENEKVWYSRYLISKDWVIFGEDSKGLVCLGFFFFGLPQSAEYFAEAKVLPQRKQERRLMGTLCKVDLRDRW